MYKNDIIIFTKNIKKENVYHSLQLLYNSKNSIRTVVFVPCTQKSCRVSVTDKKVVPSSKQ